VTQIATRVQAQANVPSAKTVSPSTAAIVLKLVQKIHHSTAVALDLSAWNARQEQPRLLWHQLLHLLRHQLLHQGHQRRYVHHRLHGVHASLRSLQVKNRLKFQHFAFL